MRVVFLCFSMLGGICSFGQKADSTQVPEKFKYNVDVVSRYLWRGLLLNANPNLQPYATLSLGRFSIGTWASYAVSHSYAEIDFNINYQIKNLLLTISDYYTEDETNMGRYDYLNMQSKKTNHALEGCMSYKISEKLPLNIVAATYFYGNDRDSVGDNYYSTYVEMNYPFSYSSYGFNIFIGGTIGQGYYAQEASVVNIGLSFSRQVPISNKLSIPVSASLVVNPNAKDIFMVVKLTL